MERYTALHSVSGCNPPELPTAIAHVVGGSRLSVSDVVGNSHVDHVLADLDVVVLEGEFDDQQRVAFDERVEDIGIMWCSSGCARPPGPARVSVSETRIVSWSATLGWISDQANRHRSTSPIQCLPSYEVPTALAPSYWPD